MKITTRHLDALALHTADTLNVDAATAAALVHATVGDTTDYAELPHVDPPTVGEALAAVNRTRARDGGAELVVTALRRKSLAALFASLREDTATCEGCGRLALALRGGAWVDAGRECPADGRLFARPAVERVVAWTTGEALDAGATKDRDGVPVTDASIRASRTVHAWVEAALVAEGVTLTALCGAMLHGGKVATAVAALNAVERPAEVFVDANAARLFARGAKGRSLGDMIPAVEALPVPASVGRLDGDAHRRLGAALLSAFPSRPALEQLLRFGLNANLDAVAGNGPLSAVVFEVIRWAESRGHLDALLATAQRQNPGNGDLRAFVASLSVAPDARTLRVALARLYPDVRNARRVARDAGLDVGRIDFAGSAADVWFYVIGEAEKARRVDALLAVVRDEYPRAGI